MYNDYSPEPTKQSIEVLEQRYNDESLLMEYVAHGDLHQLTSLLILIHLELSHACRIQYAIERIS